jgi:hypothetical protein
MLNTHGHVQVAFASIIRVFYKNQISKGKGKTVPLEAIVAQRVPGSFPDFMTTAQDGGKVVSLTHRPPLPPGNTRGTHFC